MRDVLTQQETVGSLAWGTICMEFWMYSLCLCRFYPGSPFFPVGEPKSVTAVHSCE